MAEPAVGRVELQQVRQRPGVGHVVDGHDLQIVSFQRAPREGTANPPEAVDSHPDRHRGLLSDDRPQPSRQVGQTAFFNSLTSIAGAGPPTNGLRPLLRGPSSMGHVVRTRRTPRP